MAWQDSSSAQLLVPAVLSHAHVSTCPPPSQVIVRVPRIFRHVKVDKDVKRFSKHWAHDEFGLCDVGDLVRLQEYRPLSKKKAHVVVEILKKEDGSPPPSPFPSF